MFIINIIKKYFGYNFEQWKWVGSVKIAFTDQNKNILSASGIVLFERNEGKFRHCSILNKPLTDDFKNHPFYYNNIIPWLNGYYINSNILDVYNKEAKSLVIDDIKTNIKPDFKLLKFEKPEETKPAS